ncbi:unnamed protein product [Cuscuta epithymum]|uniref:SPX domain-containing protein n=1 Tax=Cuscuta epithymum TaxID=186058 RepID=A0AAV0E832_9ASTE|nr:unnamed protein product [Cuscuta epithymum]
MSKEAETPLIAAQEEKSEVTMRPHSTAAEKGKEQPSETPSSKRAAPASASKADAAPATSVLFNDQDPDSDIEDLGVVVEDGLLLKYKTNGFNDFSGLMKELRAKQRLILEQNLQLKDVFESVKESQRTVQGHAYSNVTAHFDSVIKRVTFIGASLRISKYTCGIDY